MLILMKNIFGHNYILPFQGVQWNNRQLTQGVAVGLGYIAPSVCREWGTFNSSEHGWVYP